MKKILIFFLLLFVTSCNTLKQDAKRLAKIDQRHPALVAQVCDKNFKSMDSVTQVVRYIQGEPIIKYQTVRVNIDSLIKTLPPKVDSIRDTTFMDIVCPPSIIRIDTVLDDKTITSTHKANIFLLEHYTDSLTLQLINKDSTILTQKNKIGSKNKTILILSIILGLIAVFYAIRGYIKRTIHI